MHEYHAFLLTTLANKSPPLYNLILHTLLSISTTFLHSTMAATPFILSLLLSLFLHSTTAQLYRDTRTPHSQQDCRLQQLRVTRPSRTLVSEGGLTQLYDEDEDQFRCAGVSAMKNTIKPSSLSLPNYHPSPRLVYILKGRGLMGVSYPGCPETYHSYQPSGGEEGKQWKGLDRHQKVHQVSEGDVIFLTAGAVHFCYNDGEEDLVAVSMADLANWANQLDRTFKQFYLAGGPPKDSGKEWDRLPNILQNLDDETLAESFDVSLDIIRKMKNANQGFIVKVEGGLGLRIREQEQNSEADDTSSTTNNRWETPICTAKITQNINNPKSAQLFSSDAGRMTVANDETLPVLRNARLSASKLNLLPNAILAPHYSISGHSVVYVTRGEGRVQTVDDNGKCTMDSRVREGDLFVIPQFFLSTLKAGENGIETVAFQTSSQPWISPLPGYLSAFKGLPLSVIMKSYGVSRDDAREIKENRRHEAVLLSPRVHKSTA